MQIKDITSFISETVNKITPKFDTIPFISSRDTNPQTNPNDVINRESFDDKQLEQTTGDPNTFNAKRMFSQIFTQIINILKYATLPFISLMMAMIVANEMIVYAVPIRIIFFVFTLILMLFYPLVTILLPIFYLFKGGYSFYINKMTNGPKKHIMPTIYALLPITTYQPTSNFWHVLFYLFTYPKTEKGKESLPDNMTRYFDSLISSFNKYETIKGLPLFKDKIQFVETQLKELHNPTESFLGIKNMPLTNPNTTTIQKDEQNTIKPTETSKQVIKSGTNV